MIPKSEGLDSVWAGLLWTLVDQRPVIAIRFELENDPGGLRWTLYRGHGIQKVRGSNPLGSTIAMSHDIVEPVSRHRRVRSFRYGLVAPVRIQGQLTNDRAVISHDLEVGTGDEQGHGLASASVADVEMTKAAVVADGDFAVAVEPVSADSVLDRFGIG